MSQQELFPKRQVVAVVGSRDFPDLQLVRNFVRTLKPGIRVVSGGARGVDTVAEDAVRDRDDMPDPVIIRPKWRRSDGVLDMRAGLKRNKVIVDTCDFVAAFWDGKSTGTKSTIDYARKMGKPVKIIRPLKDRKK